MITIVIPVYKCRNTILSIIEKIEDVVELIIVVDDCCPENTGELVLNSCSDSRVRVIKNVNNLGVGGAVIAGFKEALKYNATVVVKIDGDGQMDLNYLRSFLDPILKGSADYVKGNRFYNLSDLVEMPKVRLIGNAILSFMSKVSTGYWSIMDPTNGYFAINAKLLTILPLDKISNRFFFESDMLFRLNTLKAKVYEIPMKSVYGEEKSNLSPANSVFPFLFKHVNRFFKRFFYNYLLRDFNIATLMTIFGITFLVFGLVFGLIHWEKSISTLTPATTGTVMIAFLPIVLGFQLLLSAIQYDIAAEPKIVVSNSLKN